MLALQKVDQILADLAAQIESLSGVPALARQRSSIVCSLASVTARLTARPSHSLECLTTSSSFSRLLDITPFVLDDDGVLEPDRLCHGELHAGDQIAQHRARSEAGDDAGNAGGGEQAGSACEATCAWPAR
jgi:hypothetical protein